MACAAEMSSVYCWFWPCGMEVQAIWMGGHKLSGSKKAILVADAWYSKGASWQSRHWMAAQLRIVLEGAPWRAQLRCTLDE
jgi:hypothetical protein